MAKIKFGAAVADARGSVAGLVFTKNRFGTIARQKVSPVQPRSILQLAARAALQNLATRWANVLNAAQRAGWISLANINPLTNAFGDSIYLTGLQYYVRVNRNLQKIGIAPDDDAPANQNVESLLTLALTAAEGAGTMSAAFTPTPLGATSTIVIWATPPLPSGRAFNNNLLKMIGGYSAPSPSNIASAYTGRFGAFRAGQRIFIRAAICDSVTGAESADLSDDVIVAA